MYYLNSLFYQAQDLFYDIYRNYIGIAYSARDGLTLFEIEEIIYLLFAIPISWVKVCQDLSAWWNSVAV